MHRALAPPKTLLRRPIARRPSTCTWASRPMMPASPSTGNLSSPAFSCFPYAACSCAEVFQVWQAQQRSRAVVLTSANGSASAELPAKASAEHHKLATVTQRYAFSTERSGHDYSPTTACLSACTGATGGQTLRHCRASALPWPTTTAPWTSCPAGVLFALMLWSFPGLFSGSPRTNDMPARRYCFRLLPTWPLS